MEVLLTNSLFGPIKQNFFHFLKLLVSRNPLRNSIQLLFFGLYAVLKDRYAVRKNPVLYIVRRHQSLLLKSEFSSRNTTVMTYNVK